MMSGDKLAALVEKGEIEIAPLAYMRGRTLNDSFIILDEAQNTTPEQIKMFLTRLGFGSLMVVTGDITQIDLPRGRQSGLALVPEVLGEIPDISFVHLRPARRRAPQAGAAHRGRLQGVRRARREPARPTAAGGERCSASRSSILRAWRSTPGRWRGSSPACSTARA